MERNDDESTIQSEQSKEKMAGRQMTQRAEQEDTTQNAELDYRNHPGIAWAETYANQSRHPPGGGRQRKGSPRIIEDKQSMKRKKYPTSNNTQKIPGILKTLTIRGNGANTKPQRRSRIQKTPMTNGNKAATQSLTSAMGMVAAAIRMYTGARYP